MTKREERIESAVKKGYEAFKNSFSCAQSTLAGLMREFMPDDPYMDALIRRRILLPAAAATATPAAA